MRLIKESENKYIEHFRLIFDQISCKDLFCNRNKITKKWCVGEADHRYLHPHTVDNLNDAYNLAQQRWTEEQ